MTATYNPNDERCLAAHKAGEETAKKLMGSKYKYSPEYLAMAVVQDALIEFCKPAVQQHVTETKP